MVAHGSRKKHRPAVEVDRSGRARPETGLGRGGRIALAAILVAAAAFRLIALDRVPPGINQDEANRAYEAFCLRRTGHDRYEKTWPIFFRAFGAIDYPPGTYIYLLIPVQAVLGMTIWSTRLPAALLGTLNVWLVYLLLRRLYSRRVGLLGALLLAVSPWHVHLSRVAFEVSLCPPLVTLGFYLIARCGSPPGERPIAPLPRRELLSLAGAGLALGTALWTYNALRVVVPLLLVGGGLLYAREVVSFLRRPRAGWGGGLFAAGLLLALAPFIWASIRTPEEAWARAAAINLFRTSSGTGQALLTMLRVYALHFDPVFWFIKGDLVQSVAGCGLAHYYCAALIPLGIYRAIRRWRTERFGLLTVWWLLSGPLPAAGTDAFLGNALRMAGLLPADQILAALGLDLVIAAVQRRSAATRRSVLATATVIITANIGYFVYLLVAVYPTARARYFQAEWTEAVREVRRLEPDYDLVLLTNRQANQVAILYLFWNQIEPAEYFQMPRRIRQGREWDATLQLGKVFFVSSDQLDRIAGHLSPGARVLVGERPGVPVGGRPIGRFDCPDRSAGLVLYDVRFKPGPGS